MVQSPRQASVPMSDAVMNRNPDKKKKLSLMFLLGWIVLGVMSALDVNDQLNGGDDEQEAYVWLLCLLGPFTVILSQKILFGARKMGTFWEDKGSPNFSPIVYNMGGPLFVWGWFFFWLGISCLPNKDLNLLDIYSDVPNVEAYVPVLPALLHGQKTAPSAGVASGCRPQTPPPLGAPGTTKGPAG